MGDSRGSSDPCLCFFEGLEDLEVSLRVQDLVHASRVALHGSSHDKRTPGIHGKRIDLIRESKEVSGSKFELLTLSEVGNF